MHCISRTFTLWSPFCRSNRLFIGWDWPLVTYILNPRRLRPALIKKSIWNRTYTCAVLHSPLYPCCAATNFPLPLPSSLNQPSVMCRLTRFVHFCGNAREVPTYCQNAIVTPDGRFPCAGVSHAVNIRLSTRCPWGCPPSPIWGERGSPSHVSWANNLWYGWLTEILSRNQFLPPTAMEGIHSTAPSTANMLDVTTQKYPKMDRDLCPHQLSFLGRFVILREGTFYVFFLYHCT